MRDVEIAVVGLGTIGSAALYHLARAGTAPLGIEQYYAAHPFGSSYGHSRGFRTFYHDPLYMTWAEASLPMWQELESVSGERLLTLCGWVAFAKPENAAFQRNLRVMQGSVYLYQVMTPAELAGQFPGLQIPPDTVACYTPRAGMLDANRCVQAHLAQATRLGATVQEHTRVERIRSDGDRPIVETSAGDVRCSRLILTPGPWATHLLRDLALPLQVTRQQKFYFRPRDETAYRPERMPVYVDYDTLFYGFPSYDEGIKVADDNPGEVTDPDHVDRTLDLSLRDRLQAWLAGIMPGSDLTFVQGATCMYTLTPDRDFVLGLHPLHPNIIVGAGFSGHGFKFSPLVGKILSDSAMSARSTWSIDRFSPKRFHPNHS